MASRSLAAACALALFVAGVGTRAALASTVPHHPAADDWTDASGRVNRLAYAHTGIWFGPSSEAVRASSRSAFTAPDHQAVSAATPTGLSVSDRSVDAHGYGRLCAIATAASDHGVLVSRVQHLATDEAGDPDAGAGARACLAHVMRESPGADSRPTAADIPGLLRRALEFPAQLVIATLPRGPILFMLGSGLVGWLGIGRRRGVQLQARSQSAPRADTAARA